MLILIVVWRRPIVGITIGGLVMLLAPMTRDMIPVTPMARGVSSIGRLGASVLPSVIGSLRIVEGEGVHAPEDGA